MEMVNNFMGMEILMRENMSMASLKDMGNMHGWMEPNTREISSKAIEVDMEHGML